MSLSEKLTFGRHKDKSLIDIWRGMYHDIDKKNVNDFVENTIDYFFNITAFNEKILSTGYSFSNEDIELIQYLRQNPNLRDTFQVK